MSILNFCVKSCSKIRFETLHKLNRANTLLITRNASVRGKSQVLKITICGASGRVGQPLCLLLKQSPFIDEIAVYDVNDTCSFAKELSHIDTRCRVHSYTGVDNIGKALSGSKIVIMLACAINSASLSFDAMFAPNAVIVQDLTEQIVHYCPKAFIAIATHPVNSMVPLASEILKANGVYNPKTVFGVTTIDIVRANAFVAEVQGLEPECVFVPVIGGHTDETIVPVLSQAKPCSDFTNEEIERITNKIQNAHHDMLKAKFKQGASLSCAFSIARFVMSLIKGIRQDGKIIEYAYVKSDVHREATYLATPVRLGPGGVQKNFGIPELTEYERCLLGNAIPHIARDIRRGEKFGRGLTSSEPPSTSNPRCSLDQPQERAC